MAKPTPTDRFRRLLDDLGTTRDNALTTTPRGFTGDFEAVHTAQYRNTKETTVSRWLPVLVLPGSPTITWDGSTLEYVEKVVVHRDAFIRDDPDDSWLFRMAPHALRYFDWVEQPRLEIPLRLNELAQSLLLQSYSVKPFSNEWGVDWFNTHRAFFNSAKAPGVAKSEVNALDAYIEVTLRYGADGKEASRRAPYDDMWAFYWNSRHQINVTGEFLHIPPTRLYAKVDDTVVPGGWQEATGVSIPVPIVTHTLTVPHRFFRDAEFALLEAALGHVNDGLVNVHAFRGSPTDPAPGAWYDDAPCQPDTLLFESFSFVENYTGMELFRYESARQYLTLQLVFKQRDFASQGDRDRDTNWQRVTWQHIYRPPTGTWETVLREDDSPLYPRTDFSDLFLLLGA